jgi:hypothetical protein
MRRAHRLPSHDASPKITVAPMPSVDIVVIKICLKNTISMEFTKLGFNGLLIDEH